MPTLSQSRIGQIAVVCQDVQRARAFYKDTLGLTHLFDAGPNLTFFDCGGTRLMLSTVENAEQARMSSMLYYFVTGIESVCADLASRGVEFPEAPHMVARLPDREVWLAACHDSEGNMLGIMEERKR